MAQYNVVRLGLPPYLPADFASQERAMVESLDLHYQCQRSPRDALPSAGPLILITNSQSQLMDLKAHERNRIELIIHPNSGYENIAPFMAQYPHLPIALGPGIRQKAVAQYVLACLFDRFAPLPWCRQWDPQRAWPRTLIDRLNIQLIGYGHVGTVLANTLSTLSDAVFIYDPAQGRTELNVECAHVLVLAPSLHPSAVHFVDQSLLQTMRQDVCIIQPSRGKVVCQGALVTFLGNNPQAFAYVDVFEQEPHDFKCFQGLDNIKLTCHIAGVHRDLAGDILLFVQIKLKEFFSNLAPGRP